MRPVRIHHHLEFPVVFHQLIDQHFRPLVMDIIIPRAVYYEQIAPQVFRIGQG